MSKQRTLFFGKIPQKSPKKNGDNRPVNKRRFRAVAPEALAAVNAHADAVLRGYAQ